MLRRTFAAAATLVLISAVWLVFNYIRHDTEVATIDEQIRHSTSGSFLRLSNGVTHYDLQGPADAQRTVVFIHGFSVPYYLWDGIFQATTQAGYRALRYDLFGRGFSDRLDVEYGAVLYDRQLVELLDGLNIRSRIDIVGSSMGGPIAADFACRHTERVRTLSLFDPGFSHGQQMPAKLRLRWWGEYTMAVDIASHLAESQMNDFAHPDRFPHWVEMYRPQMKYKGFRASLLSTLRNYLSEDWSKYYDCVGKTNIPVFLAWGKQDRDVPFEVSREVQALIPRTEFLPVEDAAHVPFIERPEVVYPAFLGFLSRQ